ncbi:PilZ domain-containing protein [Cytobacillus sp. FJAT-54145]|uniref:PilZ domain-containing protein n=1 Tax=Cytobacillus spartinae TaxID=3299023 RepID=A0ABW6KHE1_9BACI
MEYITLIHKNKRILAALFQVEGEMINVVVKRPDLIKTGDSFDCLIEGDTIGATVLKKDQNNLYLFVPYFKIEKFHSRRRSIRCRIHSTGEIYPYSDASFKYDITVIDISLNGIGFISEVSVDLNIHYILHFYLETKFVSCVISIKNKSKIENGFRYGCEINELKDKSLFYLRKYLLKTQLEKI